MDVLYDSGCIRDPADLYTIKIETMAGMVVSSGVIGVSRAKQIVDNINSKRVLPLDVFLGALGIELLGSRRAKLMIDAAGGKLSHIEDWVNTELLRTIELPGFGDTMRESICEGIESNRWLIKKLLACGVVIIADKPDTHSNSLRIQQDSAEDLPFAGLSFCLTGTRAYIKEIEELGGEVKSGVSRGLTFLVQADPMSISAKTRKAEEYGVRVISLEYLKKAIDKEVSLF